MTNQQAPAMPPGVPVDIVGKVLGLLVFLAGIAMIVLVFTWVHDIFQGIDQQVGAAHQAYVADLAARQQASEAEAGADTGESPEEPVVVATPGGGPTLPEIAATLALKMLGLLVLGWLGALVAAKGAHLATGYRAKSG